MGRGAYRAAVLASAAIAVQAVSGGVASADWAARRDLRPGGRAEATFAGGALEERRACCCCASTPARKTQRWRTQRCTMLVSWAIVAALLAEIGRAAPQRRGGTGRAAGCLTGRRRSPARRCSSRLPPPGAASVLACRPALRPTAGRARRRVPPPQKSFSRAPVGTVAPMTAVMNLLR